MANARYGNALQGAAAVYRSKRAAMNKSKKRRVSGSARQEKLGEQAAQREFSKGKKQQGGGWSKNDVAGHSSRHPRHVGGGGMFNKAKNATHVGGWSRSSGKMSVSGNAYHNGPGAASTGRRDNAGNSTSRSNAFKAGRLRRKFSGEFGGTDQIRKFRKPKRLKIHRNPGGIVY